MFDIRRLDIYRKVPKDLTQPTLTGAFISVGCVCFIAFLLASELFGYLRVEVTSELFVDDPSKEGTIPVVVDVSLPELECQFLGLDIQDEMGRHEVGFHQNTKKTPIPPPTKGGKSGCRFHGVFNVNKVPGNFHLSTHSAKSQPQLVDFTHTINSLSFGVPLMDYTRGSFNPLEKHSAGQPNTQSAHDYVLKIVPTIYEQLNGAKTYTYQFSYAHKEHVTARTNAHPAVWFRYELSPLTIKYTEKRQPFYTLLTSVCAIVGGTFTVAGIIDSLLFTATEYYRKLELGKLS